jgi:hypothetical protein
MGYDLLSSARKAMAVAGLALAVWASPGATASPSDPFDQLKGDWKGGGTVWPADGQPKKVDCSV